MPYEGNTYSKNSASTLCMQNAHRIFSSTTYIVCVDCTWSIAMMDIYVIHCIVCVHSLHAILRFLFSMFKTLLCISVIIVKYMWRKEINHGELGVKTVL